MCGLWASVGLTPAHSVIDLVAHRGPDGAGWETLDTPAGPLVLAHRRLAIVDLDDRGLQPMRYGDGRYWITYNGEVYNHPELREELVAKGHRFATATDTEVLLAAYAEWGEACLDRLNGMFAFVIYDQVDQILFAARDRFGIKPLYLYRCADRLAFASEIKQFTALPEFDRRLNRPRAFDFLAGGLFDHTNETLFADAEQLRGGECLRIDLSRPLQGAGEAIRSWYELPAPDTLDIAPRQAAEQLRHLLTESVRYRLRADVPVGSCLSGGLDSSSIVCLVQALRSGEAAPAQHSYSACFTEPEADERRHIEAVLEGRKIAANFVTPDPDHLFPTLDRLVWHQDEPFGSTSIFAQWEVFRLAGNDGTKVMLDGQGADEQLAGYHSMFGAFLAELLLAGRWSGLAREFGALRQRHGSSFGRLGALLLASALPAPAYRAAERLSGRRARPAWMSREPWDGCQVAEPPFRAPPQLGSSPLGRLCRHQVLVSSLPMLLHYEDRNSMAHSIEARVPFLDHRLVELTIALGGRHKLVEGETKHVLRSAMKGILPESVRTRQDKMGFATPERSWLRDRLASSVLTGVEEAATQFPELFESVQLDRLARRVLAGRSHVDWAIWRVLSFAAWGRVFRVGL